MVGSSDPPYMLGAIDKLSAAAAAAAAAP